MKALYQDAGASTVLSGGALSPCDMLGPVSSESMPSPTLLQRVNDEVFSLQRIIATFPLF